jgi:hypothetical protein
MFLTCPKLGIRELTSLVVTQGKTNYVITTNGNDGKHINIPTLKETV